MSAPITRALLLTAFLAPAPLHGAAPPPRPKESGPARERKINNTIKEVAGSAEYLRSVPKRFATLRSADAARQQVTLLLEGEKEAKAWPLADDAEVKVAGWWGRLDQFTAGDRVWVWFQTSRKGRPVAVAMLADEPSEQDMHGPGVTLEKYDGAAVVLKSEAGSKRTLPAGAAEAFQGAKKVAADGFPVGKRVYAQTAGGRVRLLLDPAAFEARRAAQREALRKRWLQEGLPGAVTFVHRFSGEMDFMLDHEAMRWGRSLKLGDKVTLQAEEPVPAVVKSVSPWRERTQLRLVAKSAHLTDLRPGQRLRLRMPPPPAAVEQAVLPPDLDRPRTREERVEWFLATIYCTCRVHGDRCTGHFYTLASCNPNGCGMPRAMRKELIALIDKGLTDRQILEALLKEHGPELLRPHLLP
jgi:hypothetical protein